MKIIGIIAACLTLVSCQTSLYPYQGVRGLDRYNALKFSSKSERTRARVDAFEKQVFGDCPVTVCPHCHGYGYYNVKPTAPFILSPENIDPNLQYEVEECKTCNTLGIIHITPLNPAYDRYAGSYRVWTGSYTYNPNEGF